MLIHTPTGYIKSPYNMGDCRLLENYLSIYIPDTDEYVPYGFIVHDNALYIPNINIDQFMKPLNESKIIEAKIIKPKQMTKRHMSKVDPRDAMQHNVIEFITGTGHYTNNKSEHQIGIVAHPGAGKTFTTIYAITEMNTKALIVTHMTKIKNQWIDTFTRLFDYDPDEIKTLTTSDLSKVMNNEVKMDYNIYFISHQIINRWIAEESPTNLNKVLRKLGIGIKVVDEYHLHWKNSLILDMFTNVDKTVYLTATFSRSDQSEATLFKRVTSNVVTYGSEDRADEDKHTIYHPVMYSSQCPFKKVKSFASGHGMGIRKWLLADWLHIDDPKQTTNNIIFDLVGKCLTDEGKILITVGSIKASELLAEEMSKRFVDVIVGAINSTHTSSDNEYNKEHARIIVSTIQSSGTGLDIKKLRYVINAEPFCSKLTAEQFLGRLRPYHNDDGEQLTTFLFDLVDTSIYYCNIYYKGRSKRIIQLAKETIPLK